MNLCIPIIRMLHDKKMLNHKSVLKKVHRQGITQEFNVGIDSYVSITL